MQPGTWCLLCRIEDRIYLPTSCLSWFCWNNHRTDPYSNYIYMRSAKTNAPRTLEVKIQPQTMSFEVVNQPPTRKTHHRTISALESPHSKRVFGVRFANIKEEQAAPYELSSRTLNEPRLVHVKIFKDENNEYVFLKGEKDALRDRRHSVSSAKTSTGSPTFM